LVTEENGDRLQSFFGRIKFSTEKISLPFEAFGVPFYRRVGMEEAKMPGDKRKMPMW
jgi:hypothetical protein